MEPSEENTLRPTLRHLPVFAGELPRFAVDAAPADPVDLFRAWLLDAVNAGLREPHVMTLSTADAAGRPSARALILRDLTEQGWCFGTTAGSRKARDLAARPAAALSFYWRELGRQVRIRGTASPLDAEQNARDFLARSPGSRAETLVGHSSEPLGSLAELDAAFESSLARVEADPGLVAPSWTVYVVRADEVEFFQANAERRHTRLQYQRTADGWQRGLLWP